LALFACYTRTPEPPAVAAQRQCQLDFDNDMRRYQLANWELVFDLMLTPKAAAPKMKSPI
jgi:hypothetical protein